MARDHPRIRGTNGRSSNNPCMIVGSSPHTRDKFHAIRMWVWCCRIIPAYAGQIGWSVILYFPEWDHPRIRGTNADDAKEMNSRLGSSPHTRDKYSVISPKWFCLRIIPAYAGQMKDFSFPHSRFQDHPRIRGTNVRP